MRKLLRLENAIRELTAERDAMLDALLDDLLAGAGVEEGTNAAELGWLESGAGRREVGVLLNGKAVNREP